jgi:hypothetical protein
MLPRLSLLVEFLMLRTSLELSLIRSSPTLFLNRLARRRLMRLQGVLLTRALASIMPFSCRTCHYKPEINRRFIGNAPGSAARISVRWLTTWYESPPVAIRGSLAAGCSSCTTIPLLGPVVGKAQYERSEWAGMRGRACMDSQYTVLDFVRSLRVSCLSFEALDEEDGLRCACVQMQASQTTLRTSLKTVRAGESRRLRISRCVEDCMGTCTG